MDARHEKNEGFTLVELVVTIAAASIVLFAFSSTLLLGLRLNRASLDANVRRQNVRTVLTLAENVCRGTEVRVEASTDESPGWSLSDNETPILCYDADAQTIKTGGGDVLLADVENSALEIDEGGSVLTISLTTDGETYTDAVYCRLGVAPEETPEDGAFDAEGTAVPDARVEALAAALDPDSPRGRVLELLLSQRGSSGWILGGDGQYTYYSEWYIDGYKRDWDEDTPWCACFLSWALDRESDAVDGPVPRFADVNKGMAWFRDAGLWRDGSDSPAAGDCIFFDWEGDGVPDHVGMVLAAGGGTVCTVEGNSAGRVRVCAYPAESPQIIGCGALNWAA